MSQYFPSPAEFGRHTIFGHIQIRTCAGEHVQFSLVDIPAGGVVESHSHANEQMGLVLEGEMDFTIGGETRRLRPGDVFRIPGGVVHSVVAGDRPVKALDVFYPIRDEYR
jgi:quercetin dioxygenase-like cupin family protein